MEMIFMNIQSNKTHEPEKFVLNLSQRLDLRSSNKTKMLLFKTCLFITPGKI